MINYKRFTTKNIICSNYCVWDNNDKPYGNDDVVVLLNEYENKCNEFSNKIQKLNKVIDLMEYQMKVQDRIIKEYEDGD